MTAKKVDRHEELVEICKNAGFDPNVQSLNEYVSNVIESKKQLDNCFGRLARAVLHSDKNPGTISKVKDALILSGDTRFPPDSKFGIMENPNGNMVVGIEVILPDMVGMSPAEVNEIEQMQQRKPKIVVPGGNA